jgi:uncharacterized protein YhaN
VRLAFGRLLAGEEGAPVILDDAMVSSDPERLRQLADVLGAVDDQLQIILLTCHWEQLRGAGLGAELVREMTRESG